MKPVAFHHLRPESVEEIVEMLSGRLCRCTVYEPTVEAITQAAEAP